MIPTTINLCGEVGSAFSAIFQLGDVPSGVPITAVTAGTPIVITVADNDFVNGQYVGVTNCNEEADGVWVVETVSGNTFALTGSVGEMATVGTNALVSKGLDATSGSIAFTAKNATWVTGQSILMNQANLNALSTAIEAFTFAWGATLPSGQVISAGAGQSAGLFTISLTSAQMTALAGTRTATLYYRIFFVDSNSIPTEQFRGSFSIQ